MKNAVVIFFFTIAVTMFYWYVGQQVPQKVTYPPEELEIRADLTTAEMVKIGQEIVEGKGTCQSCHGLPGGRFPDLAAVGASAGSRIAGMSDVEYIAESIYDPGAFIVPGYSAGMTPIHKPPVSLNDNEILTVIAYLQSQGGTATVTMESTHKFSGQSPVEAGGSKIAVAASISSNMSGEMLFQSYGCAICHQVDAPGDLVGPSLYDLGKLMSNAEIYQSIVEPDAIVKEGYAPGVMKATLDARQFYDNLSMNDLKKLVDYLSSLKGS